MKAVYTFNDEQTGKIYVVLPKIREVRTALGSLVITYDNGDRHTFEVSDLKQTLDHLVLCLENYYQQKA